MEPHRCGGHRHGRHSPWWATDLTAALPRAVELPSPASWATSTTSGAAGSHPVRWTVPPSPVSTAARPTAPRLAMTTTCAQSTLPR